MKIIKNAGGGWQLFLKNAGGERVNINYYINNHNIAIFILSLLLKIRVDAKNNNNRTNIRETRVFITNKLINKTTKAVQSRAAIFSFIVRLKVMRQIACILRPTLHGSNIMLHIRCFSPTVT